MTYTKEWPYYSKKNEQIHIMTLSYYSNKSIFFKADCVRSKHGKRCTGFWRKLSSANHMNLPREIQLHLFDNYFHPF